MKKFWVNGLNKMGIESGDYVLASEAKDQDDWNVKKLKELELEQIKANERIKELENQLSPLSSATPSYVAGLNERIKVLEDALKFYQYVENYKSTTPVARGDGSYDYDVPVLIDNGEIARAALEVK